MSSQQEGPGGQPSFLNAPVQEGLTGESEHGHQARAMSSGCVSLGLSSFTSVTRLVFFRMEVLWDQSAMKSLNKEFEHVENTGNNFLNHCSLADLFD